MIILSITLLLNYKDYKYAIAPGIAFYAGGYDLIA